MRFTRLRLILPLCVLAELLPVLAGAGQALTPINIATSAAGQSGYIAALIENKKLDNKYGIKITNMKKGPEIRGLLFDLEKAC